MFKCSIGRAGRATQPSPRRRHSDPRRERGFPRLTSNINSGHDAAVLQGRRPQECLSSWNANVAAIDHLTWNRENSLFINYSEAPADSRWLGCDAQAVGI